MNEGVDVASYALDENLIAFGTAVELGDLDQGADILDPLELTPDTEAMWMQLSQQALEDRTLVIAERCYAALGYVTKARYLHATNKNGPQGFQGHELRRNQQLLRQSEAIGPGEAVVGLREPAPGTGQS